MCCWGSRWDCDRQCGEGGRTSAKVLIDRRAWETQGEEQVVMGEDDGGDGDSGDGDSGDGDDVIVVLLMVMIMIMVMVMMMMMMMMMMM